MTKMAHKPAEANRAFSVMRKMLNLAEAWGYRLGGTKLCRQVSMYPDGKASFDAQRQRRRDERLAISKRAGPLGERQTAAQYHGSLLVALGYHVEEQVGLIPSEGR